MAIGVPPRGRPLRTPGGSADAGLRRSRCRISTATPEKTWVWSELYFGDRSALCAFPTPARRRRPDALPSTPRMNARPTRRPTRPPPYHPCRTGASGRRHRREGAGRAPRRVAPGRAVSSCCGATASRSMRISATTLQHIVAVDFVTRVDELLELALQSTPAVGSVAALTPGRPRVLSWPSASRRAAARTSNQQHDLYCTRVHSDDVGDVARWRRVCHDAGIRRTRRTPASSTRGSSRRVARHARLVARTAALLRCGWRCIREGGSGFDQVLGV